MNASKTFAAILAVLGGIAALANAIEIPVKAPLRNNGPTTITTTETVETSESQSLTLTATAALPLTIAEFTTTLVATEPTFTASLSKSTGVDCSVTLPGLVMRPCIVRSTVLSHSNGSDPSFPMMTYWSFNTTTTTYTQIVTSIPVASTTTRTASEAQSKNLATGLCFWAEQQILTPCTSMVASSSTGSKTSAAIHVVNNPFRGITGYAKSFVDRNLAWFKSTFAFFRKYHILAAMSNDCDKRNHMAWAPLFACVVIICLTRFILYNSPSRDRNSTKCFLTGKERKAVIAGSLGSCIILSCFLTYFELLQVWMNLAQHCPDVGAICPRSK